MDTNFYDVVVCGGELAGLVTAALLARRGFRVLVLGHDADRAGFDARGTILSRAPALLPPLDEPPAARVWNELDCSAQVRRRAPGPDPGLRVVLPGRHVDFGRDPAAQERELTRAFGASGTTLAAIALRVGGLGQLLDPLLASALALPPNGFWERREVGRLESLLPRAGTDLYAPLPAEHPFRTAVLAAAVHGTGLAPHEIRAVTEARAFTLARRTQHVFDGGLAALQDLVLARLETFGGDQRTRVTPVELILRRRRVAGVRVRPRDETIGCHFLIWAGPAAALAAIAPVRADHGPGGRGAGLRPAGYRYGLSLLVDPAAIPPGTPARILTIGDPSRALVEDNALSIVVGQSAREGGGVPAWVECSVPAHAVDAGPGYLRALRGRVLHTLARYLPDLARRATLIASGYDGLAPEPREQPAGAAAPSPKTSANTPAPVAAAPPPPLFAPPTPRPLDVLGLPHAVAGMKNVYVVGRENLPGLGLEGELVSGWGAARLVSGGHPRRTPPTRRVLLGG